jgi:hypothetical protein
LNSNRRIYELTILALLAACNAILELTIGNYLHYIKFPMVGSLMVTVNVIVYTVGYSMVPRKGSILTMGFLTALLNFLLGGTFKIPAIFAIVFEALIIEVIVSVLGFNFASILTASISANLFSLLWIVGFYGVVMGRGGAVERFIMVFSKPFGDDIFIRRWLILAVFIIIILHAASGIIGAKLAWKLKNLPLRISKRSRNVREMEKNHS